jgi:ribosomal protein S18 acetylase RimI-like enzyme
VADDAALVSDLWARINAAYGQAEEALWAPGTDRVELERVIEIVAAGEMAVARVNGRIVGSIRVRMLDPHTGYFGLLAVHPDDQRRGVGRELILFAERFAREQGATHMELRLLVPREGVDRGKGRLHEWYSRLGYRVTERRDFAKLNPEAAAAMRTPLDLLTFRKAL